MWPNEIMIDVLIQERELDLINREREYRYRSELALAGKNKGALRRGLTAGRNAVRRVWSPRQAKLDRVGAGSPNVEVPT